MESKLFEKKQKLLIHPDFFKTVSEIKSLRIRLPREEQIMQPNFDGPVEGSLVLVEGMAKIKLDAKNGAEYAKNKLIAAYDESTNKYSALEGTGLLASHSLVILGKYEYLPANLIAFYFYTRSKSYEEKSKYIKYAEDFQIKSQEDYYDDRSEFINNQISENSILFIDGPYSGGNNTSFNYRLCKKLAEKNTLPIFLVKNSSGNLVPDNVKELKGKYNSDLHWTHEYLSPGQRSSFFIYEEARPNPSATTSKAFCYLKAFDGSPQRLEFSRETFEKNRQEIEKVAELAYYLFLLNGPSPPELRPVAVAEMYARETLKLVNFKILTKELGLTDTVNQERFA